MNGDGHTDFGEEAVGFAIMEEMMSEDESSYDFDDDSADDWKLLNQRKTSIYQLRRSEQWH